MLESAFAFGAHNRSTSAVALAVGNSRVAVADRGIRKPAQVFNNRSLEKLFQEFESLKFFLARDKLREVIVRR